MLAKKWEIRETCLRFCSWQTAELGLHSWQPALVSVHVSTPPPSPMQHYAFQPNPRASDASIIHEEEGEREEGKLAPADLLLHLAPSSSPLFLKGSSERSVSLSPIYKGGKWQLRSSRLQCWNRGNCVAPDFMFFTLHMSLPCGSAGKESTCSAGDPGSTPGLGRSPGEENGYPLQNSGLENWTVQSMGLQRVTFTHTAHIRFLKNGKSVRVKRQSVWDKCLNLNIFFIFLNQLLTN